jgi:HAMP domain-containing protein
MMSNLSIRTRILAGVVLVNLIGAIAVVVYLHGAYSGGLDDHVQECATASQGAWEQLVGETPLDPIADPARAQAVLDSMKAISGADYGLLIDKEATTAEAFGAARETLGQPSSWEEGENYAPLCATDEDVAAKMVFEEPVSDVAETARVVGVENGECSQACHNGLTQEGAYWTVKWSTDGDSRGHAIFPVYGATGDAAGIVYMVENVTAEAQNAQKSVTQTLFVVLATLVVATLLIGALIDILILRRLKSMTKSIEEISLRLAGGDFDAEYEPDGTTDEIGSFEEFFSDFIKLVSTTLKTLASRGQ